MYRLPTSQPWTTSSGLSTVLNKDEGKAERGDRGLRNDLLKVIKRPRFWGEP
jgi:hypothetical protein